MDAIRFLLGFMFRIAIVLFFAAIVWWLMSAFFPSLRTKSLFSLNGTSTVTGGWLPAPGSFKGIFGQQKNSGNGKVFVSGKVFDGYANQGDVQSDGQGDYVTYTDGTMYTGNPDTFNNQQITTSKNVKSSGYSQKGLYIRNLSIYEGGHAYTGLSFVGEARDTLFQNGKFPIIILNNAGQVVSVSYAEATSNWSIPGWVRFQVKINDVLPNKVSCTMVFEESRGTYTYKTAPPMRVAIPVLCN